MALTAASLAVLSAPASAGIPCEGTTAYRIVSATDTFMPGKGNAYKDGPGGQMSVSVEEASTISGTFGTTVAIEIGVIFSKIKAEVSASVTKSRTVTTGHTYTQDIAPGRYGHLRYGSWGVTVQWVKEYQATRCVNRYITSGTAKLPTIEVGWKYRETAS